ncbi:MAG: PTS sugar transporter subunit IIA [Pseudomonadota bacterium]|mgnify:CR=1 FL=1
MPLTVADSITDDDIIINLESTSKKHALETLSQHLAHQHAALSADAVFDALVERERLGCTAADHGLAMPHARVDAADEPVGVFARLSKAIDFDGKDVPDVDLLFCFILPPETSSQYDAAMQLLASRLMNEAVCNKLRTAVDAQSIIRLLQRCAAVDAPANGVA